MKRIGKIFLSFLSKAKVETVNFNEFSNSFNLVASELATSRPGKIYFLDPVKKNPSARKILDRIHETGKLYKIALQYETSDKFGEGDQIDSMFLVSKDSKCDCSFLEVASFGDRLGVLIPDNLKLKTARVSMSFNLIKL